jgi:hypothetical protein
MCTASRKVVFEAEVAAQASRDLTQRRSTIR